MKVLGNRDAMRTVYGSPERMRDFLQHLEGSRYCDGGLASALDRDDAQSQALALDILRGWRQLDFNVDACLLARVIAHLIDTRDPAFSAAADYRNVASLIAAELMRQPWARPAPESMVWAESVNVVQTVMWNQQATKLRHILINDRLASAQDSAIDIEHDLEGHWNDGKPDNECFGSEELAPGRLGVLSLRMLAQIRRMGQEGQVYEMTGGIDSGDSGNRASEYNPTLAHALSHAIENLMLLQTHPHAAACDKVAGFSIPYLPARRDISALLFGVLRSLHDCPHFGMNQRKVLYQHVLTEMAADFALFRGMDARPLTVGRLAPLGAAESFASSNECSEWHINLLAQLPKELDRFLSQDLNSLSAERQAVS